jgi:polysaccharide export outer membrane protein
MLGALTAAGGPTGKAALSRASILRGSTSIPVDLRGLRADAQTVDAIKLLPGDTIMIPENKLEYAVFGAVRTPGMTTYPDDAPVTVLAALSRAGGQTETADLKNASLIRPSTDGKPTMVAINVEAMLKKGELSQDVPVQPGDILFVPTRKQGRMGPRDTLGFFREIVGFLPFATFFSHR